MSLLLSILASVLDSALVLLQSDAARPEYKYSRPFLQPMPLWNDAVWPWLLVPLCVGVAIVYKSIKCRTMREVPREAAVLSLWILGGMAAAAVGLGILVRLIERV